MDKNKTFVFDLYGTIIDIITDEDSYSFYHQLVTYLNKYNIIYDENELKSFYRLCCKNEEKKFFSNPLYSPFENYYEIDIKKVLYSIFTNKNYSPSDNEVSEFACFFRKSSYKIFQLYPKIKEILSYLKNNHNTIILLSNAQSIFTNYELKDLDLLSYFDYIFLSSDYGIKKPNLNFFKLINTKFDINYNNSVMIGNDMNCDIIPANELGMTTIYLDTKQSSKILHNNSTFSIINNNEIKQFSDLYTLIKKLSD